VRPSASAYHPPLHALSPPQDDRGRLSAQIYRLANGELRCLRTISG
jgi:hypothetical protein